MSNVNSISSAQNAIDILMNSGSNDMITSIVKARQENTANQLSKYLSTTSSDSDYENVLQSVNSVSSSIISLTTTASDSNSETLSTDQKIASYISTYNNMISTLDKVGGSLKDTFMEELSTSFSNQEEAFQKIGISMNESGSLEIDKDVFAAASDEDKSAVLGNSSTYLSNVSSSLNNIVTIVTKAITVSSALSTNYSSQGSSSDTSYSSIFQSLV